MTEPRTRSWMPPIPAPLQRLFDHFPLVTYPPNELPARSPRSSSLPTLYIFASDEGAARGRPSFNPTCLKWQTFLRLSRLPHATSRSTNHSSPTGALPFLLPPIPPIPQLPPRSIPSSRLESYLLAHHPSADEHITPTTSLPAPVLLEQEPYLSLLDSPIRAAWLTALYLDPVNTPLLQELYITPASSSPLVRAALLRQTRQAAEDEVLKLVCPTAQAAGGWKLTFNELLEFGPGAKPRGTVHPEEIYGEAEKAFDALALLLRQSRTGWFFGLDKPGLFDAAVFAYTCLAVDRRRGRVPEEAPGGFEWRDGGRLDAMVRRAGDGELERHRERVWDICWPGVSRDVKEE